MNRQAVMVMNSAQARHQADASRETLALSKSAARRPKLELVTSGYGQLVSRAVGRGPRTVAKAQVLQGQEDIHLSPFDIMAVALIFLSVATGPALMWLLLHAS
jgi:hypothetical protein